MPLIEMSLSGLWSFPKLFSIKPSENCTFLRFFLGIFLGFSFLFCFVLFCFVLFCFEKTHFWPILCVI